VLGFTAHVIVAADVDQAWLGGQLRRWQLSEAFLPPFLGALAARVGRRVDGIDLLAGYVPVGTEALLVSPDPPPAS
jgi:hypothetical protein